MSYAIESIAKVSVPAVWANIKATIDWLLTDSRSLSFPEETLFCFNYQTKQRSPLYPLIYMTGAYVIL